MKTNQNSDESKRSANMARNEQQGKVEDTKIGEDDHEQV